MDAPSDNPFAALEEAAARQVAEEAAWKGIAGARAKLVLGNDPRSAFFATLALRLKVEMDWETETMATDGRTLFVNPEWSNALTHDERTGIIAHESLHCALTHHCRREGRDPGRWNEACDCAINQVLLQSGFVLPKTRLMPGEGKYEKLPLEKSAEEYYALLAEPPSGTSGEQESGADPEGCGGADPGGCGEVRDAKDPADAADQKAEWENAISQAEQASKGRGDLPAGLARLVGQVLHPPADWRDILREFVQATARNDYSWNHPNRRHVAAGLYLPGMRSQELGEVVIAVDTSGSVGPDELAVFGSEVEAILGAFDCSATIVYHDAAVVGVEEWRSSDGPLSLKPVGGGGTDHRPVFEWVEKEGRCPACIVCLTDLETTFPETQPDVPVLWAVVGSNQAPAPFGRVVHMSS